MSNPFGQDVLDAVCEHMNVDHPQDTLVICQGVGGQPDATAATMTGFDAEAADFTATVADSAVSLRIPWSQPIDQRPQVRQEIVKLFEASKEKLG